MKILREGRGHSPACLPTEFCHDDSRCAFSLNFFDPRNRNHPRRGPWVRIFANGPEDRPEVSTDLPTTYLATAPSPLLWIFGGLVLGCIEAKFCKKYGFENSRRDLHNALLCTVQQSQFLCKQFANFLLNICKLQQILMKFSKNPFKKILLQN